MKRPATHRQLQTPAPGERAGGQLQRSPQAAVLSLQRSIGNRATGRLLAREPASTSTAPTYHEWTLLYKDKFGSFEDDDGNLRWRRIELDDHELGRDYIDANIDHATAMVELETGHYDQIEVIYKDGRKKRFKRGELPSTANYAAGRRQMGVGAVLLDAFERHDDDGFIYPTYKGQIVLTPAMAPNLTSIREQADAKAKELASLRKLAYITGQFINIIGMYSSVIGELHGMNTSIHEESSRSMRVESEAELEPSTEGATPREEPTTHQTGPGGEPEHQTPMALPNDEPTPSRPPAREPARPTPRTQRDSHEVSDEIPKKPPRKKSSRPFYHKDPDTGERSGTSGGQKRGSLEGQREFKVMGADGNEITDIDHIEGGVLWEEKSAVNAPDVNAWVEENVTNKFDAYLQARARLPAEYAKAPIGFRFTKPVKLELSTAVYDKITELQELHPDVEIQVDFAPGTGR